MITTFKQVKDCEEPIHIDEVGSQPPPQMEANKDITKENEETNPFSLSYLSFKNDTESLPHPTSYTPHSPIYILVYPLSYYKDTFTNTTKEAMEYASTEHTIPDYPS